MYISLKLFVVFYWNVDVMQSKNRARSIEKVEDGKTSNMLDCIIKKIDSMEEKINKTILIHNSK